MILSLSPDIASADIASDHMVPMPVLRVVSGETGACRALVIPPPPPCDRQALAVQRSTTRDATIPCSGHAAVVQAARPCIDRAPAAAPRRACGRARRPSCCACLLTAGMSCGSPWPQGTLGVFVSVGPKTSSCAASHPPETGKTKPSGPHGII